jgi:hypothetical protein
MPCLRMTARTSSKLPCKHDGATWSRSERIVASVGMFAMPNKVRQLEILRPSSSERWCARND